MGIFSCKPNTQKTTLCGDCDTFSYGASWMSGWRSKMEDVVFARPNITPHVSLFAIFDGHGGDEVGKFCEENFVPEMIKKPSFKNGNYKKALEETYMRMDEMLLSYAHDSCSPEEKRIYQIAQKCGTTAIMALVTPTEVLVANAGDSKSVLSLKDKTLRQLTFEHKPLLESEKTRIKNAGERIGEGRIRDILNISRSIGDLQFKQNKDKKLIEQAVISLPDIKIEQITPNFDFLIVGCDGIYETLTIEDIRDHISLRLTSDPLGKIIEELLDRLVAKDTIEGSGCDNMSCIVIQFNKNKIK